MSYRLCRHPPDNGCVLVRPNRVAHSILYPAAVAEVISRTGRIDILVNNAGVAGRTAPVWEVTDEDWQQIIAVNMTGVFYCCRAVLPHMRARRYGRIVNIASIPGKDGNPNMCGYSATKAAVIGFTKSAGKEVATEGICVNRWRRRWCARRSWSS